MNEQEFGYQIRQALNEAAGQLDYKTTYRLEQARAAALARHRGAGSPTSTAGMPSAANVPGDRRLGWLGSLGLATPLVAIVVGFVSIYQWQQEQAIEQRISDLAAMDFAVLMDEAPIGAYADKGFGMVLRGETEDL